MSAFLDGYNYASQLLSASFSAGKESEYVEEIDHRINQLINNFNQLESNKPIDFLKGDAAEIFIAESFNVNAAVKRSGHFVVADRSTKWGSADILTNFGKNYGLKYYKDGEASAKAQMTSIFGRFNQYAKKHPGITFDDYLRIFNISSEDVYHDSMYKGQVRIIPSDQYQEAVDYLNKAIKSTARPDEIPRLKEVLEMLTVVIDDGEGVTSVELTEAQSRELAKLYAAGKLSETTIRRFGISPEQLINCEDIIREAFNAGISASVMSAAMRLAPEIIKLFKELTVEGYISEASFSQTGKNAITGAAEGFMRGGIAASLTILCKSGKLGETLKSVLPEQVAVATILAMNVIKNTMECIRHGKSLRTVADELFKDTFVLCVSSTLGTFAQGLIKIPVVGYLIGSLVGSVIANCIYNGTNYIVLSICVNTGFTLFGMVDQSYELPDEVFHYLGIEPFDFERFENCNFTIEEFANDDFAIDEFVIDEFEIKPLRRGVIAAYKVGYI
jgi:hypothetical protein